MESEKMLEEFKKEVEGLSSEKVFDVEVVKHIPMNEQNKFQRECLERQQYEYDSMARQQQMDSNSGLGSGLFRMIGGAWWK